MKVTTDYRSALYASVALELAIKNDITMALGIRREGNLETYRMALRNARVEGTALVSLKKAMKEALA